MKSEDRIVELLAESLKRQDQMVEEMKGMRSSIENLDNRMERVENGVLSVVNSMNSLADLVKVALDRTQRIDELADKIRRLEKHTGLE